MRPKPVIQNGHLRVAVPAGPFLIVFELPAVGEWQAIGAVKRETGERILLPPCFSPNDSLLEAADLSLAQPDPVVVPSA